MMKMRKPSPPLMKDCGTLTPVARYQLKKCGASCRTVTSAAKAGFKTHWGYRSAEALRHPKTFYDGSLVIMKRGFISKLE